jgi:hypothetical protein
MSNKASLVKDTRAILERFRDGRDYPVLWHLFMLLAELSIDKDFDWAFDDVKRAEARIMERNAAQNN